MDRHRQPSPSLPTIGLTAVRVALGLFWISQFSWKPPPTFGCPNDGFCLWVNKEIEHPLIPLYANFLRAVIQPNIIAFGWFTFLVETATGISLVLGLFTRLGGLVGTLWSLNLLVGLLAVPGETWWYYVSTILLNFQFFALGDRLQFSLDRRLNLPSWLTGEEP
jgi:uncharacterized membrane protein YphA (DoxX/SURF4 family)